MDRASRTSASNGVVAVVGLYAGLLGEAEREGQACAQDVEELRRANEEAHRLFEQLGTVLDQHAPGLGHAPGKRTPALVVMAIAAVLGEQVRQIQVLKGLEFAVKEVDEARAALAEALLIVPQRGPVDFSATSPLSWLVACVGDQIAAMQARLAKKRQPLPRGAGEVVAAARVLVKALGDKHSHAGNYWKRFSKAVRTLGDPGPNEAYRKAERAAVELAIGYYQVVDPQPGEIMVSERQRLYDIGKALVEAEAAIKVPT